MKKIETADWSFYPSTQEIEYPDGDKIVLPTRLSNCLECLINARGDVVDYDTLLMSVWKTTHREASTISSVISELRRVIRCSKDGTNYIKNVPKKGYRFVGEFKEIDATPQEPVFDTPSVAATADEAAHPDARVCESNDTIANESNSSSHYKTPESQNTEKQSYSTGNKKFIVIVVLILIALVIAVSLLNTHKNKTSGDESQNGRQGAGEVANLEESLYSDIEILTHESGQSVSFDVSPDLNWLVYSHKPSGKDTQRLIAKSLSTGKRLEIPFNTGEEYLSPRFSNDGKTLVYVRSTDQSCVIETIKFIDQQFLPNSIKPVANCGNSHLWTTPSFSNDDTFIYYSGSSGLNDPLKTFRADLIQGSVQQITSPTQKGRGDYSMTMSPDGNKLAIVRDEYWGQSVILIYDLKDGTIKRITTLPYVIFQIAWLDNSSIVFKNTQHRFQAYSLDTGEYRNLTTSLHQNTIYPVIRSGSLFAYQGQVFEYEIWSLDLNELEFSPEIASRFNDLYPAIAGEDIYFVSDRSGRSQIWKKSGQNFHRITTSDDDRPVNEPLFSAHSGQLYTIAQNQVLKINSETGSVEPVFTHDKVIQNASISDDGRLMTFTVEENNRYYIEALNLDTLLVSRLEAGFMGRIAANKLYFTTAQQGDLLSKSLIEGNSKLVIAGFPPASVRTWNIIDNKLVFFSEDPSNDSKVINVLNLSNSESNSIAIEQVLSSTACNSVSKKCFMTIRRSGETSIIEVRKSKEF